MIVYEEEVAEICVGLLFLFPQEGAAVAAVARIPLFVLLLQWHQQPFQGNCVAALVLLLQWQQQALRLLLRSLHCCAFFLLTPSCASFAMATTSLVSQRRRVSLAEALCCKGHQIEGLFFSRLHA